jgi:hypothetical protein
MPLVMFSRAVQLNVPAGTMIRVTISCLSIVNGLDVRFRAVGLVNRGPAAHGKKSARNEDRKRIPEIFLTAVCRRPRSSLQRVRIRINRCTIFESNFICPSFSPVCRPEFRFTVDSKRRPGGKKDPTRHTKRLIFDLRFCPRSLRI